MHKTTIVSKAKNGSLLFPIVNDQSIIESSISDIVPNSGRAFLSASPLSRFSYGGSDFKTDLSLFTTILSLAGEDFLNFVITLGNRNREGTGPDSSSSFDPKKYLLAMDKDFKDCTLAVATAMSCHKMLASSGYSKVADSFAIGLVASYSSESLHGWFLRCSSVIDYCERFFHTFLIGNIFLPNSFSMVGFVSTIFSEVQMWMKFIPEGEIYSITNRVHAGETIPTFGPIGLTTGTFFDVPLGMTIDERKAMLHFAEYLPVWWYAIWLACYHSHKWLERGVSVYSPPEPGPNPDYTRLGYRHWFRKDFFAQQPGIEKSLLNSDYSLASLTKKGPFQRAYVNSANGKVAVSRSATLADHISAVRDLLVDSHILSDSTSRSDFARFVVTGSPLPLIPRMIMTPFDSAPDASPFFDLDNYRDHEDVSGAVPKISSPSKKDSTSIFYKFTF